MQPHSSAALSSAERRVATGYSDAVGAWLEFGYKLYAARELPQVITADLQGGIATSRKMEEELLVNTSQTARARCSIISIKSDTCALAVSPDCRSH